jgi:hypothetical protein
VSRLLAPARAARLAAPLAVMLTLPTLACGFYTDDYAQLALLEGASGRRRATWLDLYRIVGDAPGELHDLVVRGPLPWWTAASMRGRFFRPLASAVLAASHALFGRAAPIHHALSILSFAGLVLAVGAFYRRALPGDRRVAALAIILFAVDGHHAHAASWIAARHLLLSTALAVLGLTAHLRAVREGWRPGRWLGPLGVAAGLLAGESALGVVAYWLAHDALAPGLDRRTRLRGCVPLLAVVAGYAALYRTLGFGAAGGDGYLDPTSGPAAYAAALAARLPALLADALARIPAELFHVTPPLVLPGLGLGAAALTALLYAAVRPAIPRDERAALRWIVPGALGALAASAGGFVGTRLLMGSCVGASALIAVLIVRGIDRVRVLAAGPRRMALRAGVAWSFGAHLVVGPITLVSGGLVLREFGAATLAAADAAEIDGPPGRQIVVVASDPGASFYAAAIRARELIAAGASWQVVSGAPHAHRFTRTGPSTIRLEVIGGRMLRGPFETLFRSVRAPFASGDRVALDGLEVTILAVDDGAPTAIELRFDVPLEDPRLVLVAWRDGRLRRLPALALGEAFDLPWSPGPLRLF